MKLKMLTMIVLFMIPSFLLCQAMYVDQGNAIAVFGSYDSETDSDGKATTIAVNGCYTLAGNIDLIVGVGKYSYSYDTDDYFDFGGTELDFAGYYHIKSENLPFNVKLGGGYGSGSFESDFFDDFDLEVTFNAMSFGGGIYKSVLKTDTYEIIPFVDVASVSTTLEMEDTYYNETDSDTDSFSTFGFGFGLMMNNGFVVEPTVSQIDGDTEINLSLGMVLPL